MDIRELTSNDKLIQQAIAALNSVLRDSQEMTLNAMDQIRLIQAHCDHRVTDNSTGRCEWCVICGAALTLTQRQVNALAKEIEGKGS